MSIVDRNGGPFSPSIPCRVNISESKTKNNSVQYTGEGDPAQGKIKKIKYGRISIVGRNGGPFSPPIPCKVNISNSRQKFTLCSTPMKETRHRETLRKLNMGVFLLLTGVGDLSRPQHRITRV